MTRQDSLGIVIIVVFLLIVLGFIAWMGKQGNTYAFKHDIWRLEERIERLEQIR